MRIATGGSCSSSSSIEREIQSFLHEGDDEEILVLREEEEEAASAALRAAAAAGLRRGRGREGEGEAGGGGGDSRDVFGAQLWLRSCVLPCCCCWCGGQQQQQSWRRSFTAISAKVLCVRESFTRSAMAEHAP